MTTSLSHLTTIARITCETLLRDPLCGEDSRKLAGALREAVTGAAFDNDIYHRRIALNDSEITRLKQLVSGLRGTLKDRERKLRFARNLLKSLSVASEDKELPRADREYPSSGNP